MPWAPKRPCPAPGCRRLLRPGQRCPEHAPPRYNHPPFHTSTYRTRRAIPDSLRRAILARDGGRCQACGALGSVVDHITPRAHGGSDDPSNLQTLCRWCSRRKTSSEAGRASQAARRSIR